MSTHFRRICLKFETDLCLKLVLLGLVLHLLLPILFIPFCVAPSNKVCQGALLGVKDALLVFEANIWLDLISVRVECGRLQTDAV